MSPKKNHPPSCLNPVTAVMKDINGKTPEGKLLQAVGTIR
jgi:hypothetical protein